MLQYSDTFYKFWPRPRPTVEAENQSPTWVCTSIRIRGKGQLSLWLFHNESTQQGAF